MPIIDFPENTVSYDTKVDTFNESSAKHQKITFYLISNINLGHVWPKWFVMGTKYFFLVNFYFLGREG